MISSLLQLFNPIALVASAAVIIPVLIHLWNIRKGKTLKVGSIALLAESSKQAARSRRITNWPLFLLRCLLLLLLAFLLAGPFWKPGKKQTAGWLLVSAPQLNKAYQQYGPEIDSLLTAGYELRDLSSARFDKIDADDTTGSVSQAEEPEIAYWSILKTLDAGMPAGFPVYLFPGSLLKDYAGPRPAVHLDLHWKPLKADRPTETIPFASYLTPEKRIKNITWTSSFTGNSYKEDSLASAPADTSPIRITIYAGRNNADGRYLKAAIDAISQFTERQIITSFQAVPQPQQLIFWLQETEPADEIFSALDSSGTLFTYDNGQGIQIFSPVDNGLHTIEGTRTQALFKYAAGPATGVSLWTLADGRPLLTAEKKDGKTIIHFKSRFNPQWTDLVWQEDFVKTLLPLVLRNPSKELKDLRGIDPLQSKPAITRKKLNRTNTSSLLHNEKDLSFAIWIAIVIVFIAERILAHHQTRQLKDA